MGLLDAITTSNESDQAAPFGGGLMGMLANPQTAGLLGMAGGLLQASGPSRLPIGNGQAIAGGLMGMQQGLGNAMQAQRTLAGLRMFQDAFNNQGAPSPSIAPSAAVTGSANVAPMSGVSAGMGSLAPSSTDAASSATAAYPAGLSPLARYMKQINALTFLGLPTTGIEAQMRYDPALQMAQPTDTQRNFAAAYGDGTPEYTAALRGYATKTNYIPPVSARPGGALQMPDGSMRYTLPAPQAGGMWATDPNGKLLLNQAGQPYQIGIGGASNIAGGMAYAKTAGEGSALPYAGLDGNGNPLPVTNRTAVATQGNTNLPLPLRNNNPGAVSPGGQVASYPDLQTGLQKMDANLASYAGQSGTDTLGGVITKWVGSPSNAPAYIKDVTSRLGMSANTQVDLTNPVQRQLIGSAIMLHENGPSALFSGSQATGSAPQGIGGAQGGGIYAQAPLGAQANAEAQAKGQVDMMNASYKEARQARSTGQNALTMLDDMSNYAQTKSPALANKLYNVQGIFSGDAQLFDKARDNLITQVSGSTGMSTDAARAIVEGAIPSYGMNSQAIQTGLGQIKGQVQMRMLKGDYLSDAYANGNAPAYNQRENQFDQMMTPAASAIIKMPPGPARNQAIAEAKSNPQDAQALRWGLNVGLLH
ncbi:hypothetical protein [Paraburkholderia sp.]|uniref:hypothetical protein n=1 Tax=Paraburkholderia sp. TaxID=1926495 RepID=UPI0039E68969